MADPVRFSIFLDEPSGATGEFGPGAEEIRVRAGDRVSGTVQVRVRTDVEFEGFKVGLLWHTEGKGNRTTASGASTLLVRGGHWRAGEQLSFPFSLDAPLGPMSYQGKLLRVVWELEARLDRSMLESDIVSSQPVVLEPNPSLAEADLGPVPQQKAKLEAAKRGLGGLWVSSAIVFLLGGVVYGAAHSWELAVSERLLLFFLLAGGFVLMLKGIWRRLGRGKLGEPTIRLSASELKRGEEVLFNLALRPGQRTELRSLEVTLECEERVVHGHGQYQSHRRKVVFEQKLSLAKGVLIEPRRGFRRKGRLTIPEDGPPSFGAPHNQVVWWLRFRGDIVGWPDWKEPFLLTVRP